MAPNPTLVVNQYPNITNLANPYKDKLQEGSQQTTEPDPIHEETVLAERTLDATSQNTEGGSSPTVNTIAKLSYELDRFTKNIMLIFHNNCTEVGDNTVQKVKETFEMFRFEVEIVKNAPRRKVNTVLDEFFLRDFTKYGCVGVVVVSSITEASSPTHGKKKNKHYDFYAQDVLRYFCHGVQPTLDGKPKIFITEASNVARKRILNFYSKKNHDVFDLRFEQFKINKKITYNSLTSLCENLIKCAENMDFFSIVRFTAETFQEFKEKSKSPNAREKPLSTSLIVSTLSKELWLWRTA